MVCTPLVSGTDTVVGFICGPARRYRRFYAHCDRCKRRTGMARRWDGIYYGYTEHCTGCGTYWMDGEPCPDEYRSKEAATRWWREAIPASEFDAWVREQERSYFDDTEPQP